MSKEEKEKKTRKRLIEPFRRWFSKRSKLLSIRVVRNCFLVAFGVLVISYIFEVTRIIVTGDMPLLEGSITNGLAVILLTACLFFMRLMMPTEMETVFKMLGFKEKDEKEK